MERKLNIYPEIEVLKSFKAGESTGNFHLPDEQTILLKSYIRLQHNGVWYDILVQKQWISEGSNFDRGITRLFKQFHKEVYLASQLYNFTDKDIPSHDQRSEKERLKEMYRR